MTKCLLKDCSIIHEFGVGFFGLVAIEEKEILLAYYWLKPKARRRRKLKIEMVPWQTHTHTQTLSHTHTHTYTLTLSFYLISHSLTDTFHSLTGYTHTLSLSHFSIVCISTIFFIWLKKNLTTVFGYGVWVCVWDELLRQRGRGRE